MFVTRKTLICKIVFETCYHCSSVGVDRDNACVAKPDTLFTVMYYIYNLPLRFTSSVGRNFLTYNK